MIQKRIMFVSSVLFLICVTFVLDQPAISAEMKHPMHRADGAILEVNIHEKALALTFDDGPNEKYTPQVLQLLRENGAKATFFVIGKRAEKYPELVKQMVTGGHEIANHTYSHPSFAHISNEKMSDEITRCEEAIVKITGHKPTLFRPPGGACSLETVKFAKQKGYDVVLWSWHQDTRDWSRPGVSFIIHRVLDGTHSGDIVLFHDHGGNRKQTIQALRTILPALRERGYKLVTVSELLAMQDRMKQVH